MSRYADELAKIVSENVSANVEAGGSKEARFDIPIVDVENFSDERPDTYWGKLRAIVAPLVAENWVGVLHSDGTVDMRGPAVTELSDFAGALIARSAGSAVNTAFTRALGCELVVDNIRSLCGGRRRAPLRDAPGGLESSGGSGSDANS